MRKRSSNERSSAAMMRPKVEDTYSYVCRERADATCIAQLVRVQLTWCSGNTRNHRTAQSFSDIGYLRAASMSIRTSPSDCIVDKFSLLYIKNCRLPHTRKCYQKQGFLYNTSIRPMFGGYESNPSFWKGSTYIYIYIDIYIYMYTDIHAPMPPVVSGKAIA